MSTYNVRAKRWKHGWGTAYRRNILWRTLAMLIATPPVFGPA
jgi:hypothetical protein